MINISSKDNQYLKLARSLHNKKGRLVAGCFLIEGLRLAKEAINAHLGIQFALISEQADRAVCQLAEEMAAKGITIYGVSSDLLAAISATEHSQGIALVGEIPAKTQLALTGHYYALCDNVADPGNMGNIIRSAFAAGVSGLIVNPGCADIYNPKTVRSAMGALFHLPIYTAASDQEAYAMVRQMNLAIYTTAANGQDIRKDLHLLQIPHVWVIGSEARGVSKFWQNQANLAVSLPMHQQAESLNVAAAAAVLFYQSFFAK